MSRVLVLSPHPDDESIGCGGTICKHVAAGDEVRIVFLTSGEKGGHGTSAVETRRIRESEAASAARVPAFPGFLFWPSSLGSLLATQPAVKRIAEFF